jgi:hypothetical protein
MNFSTAPRALTASTCALMVALCCCALFLPPLVEATVSTALRASATGVVLACALLLHWAFLGLAAQRMQRSVLGWVSLSLLLFPVGSAAALILLGWFEDERQQPVAAG